MMKSRSPSIQGEKNPIACIFEKDGIYVGFSLEGTTVTFSTIPLEDVKEIRNELEKAGYRVETAGGDLQIIREQEVPKDVASNAKTAFLVTVGTALIKAFLGDDWAPDIKFVYPADIPKFTRKVLEETRRIPKGKVATYGRIAERIGSPGAARAVGNALAYNPLPLIVPCHRVVKSDRKVGGFMQMADGSVRSDIKQAMLEREGIRFLRGRVTKDQIV